MATNEFQERVRREIADEAQRRKMKNLRDWIGEIFFDADIEAIVAEVLAELE